MPASEAWACAMTGAGRREAKCPRRASPRGPGHSRGVGARDSERRSRSSCWAWRSSAPAATRCTWGGSAGRPAMRPRRRRRLPRQTDPARAMPRAHPRPSRATPGKPAQTRSPAPQVGAAGPGRGQRGADQPAALAPPGDDGPKLPPAAGDRERVRSAPVKVPTPVAAGARGHRTHRLASGQASRRPRGRRTRTIPERSSTG